VTLKVLVVDDSALYRQLVKNILRNIPSVEVVGMACTGVEALAKIIELQPHLLTLDVQMPDMNGLELLIEIKKRRMSVKTIMVSGLTARGAQVTTDALLAGAFDAIQKPNSSDADNNRTVLTSLLAEKISAFLESRNATMPKRNAVAPGAISTRACEDELGSLKPDLGNRSSISPDGLATRLIDAVVIGTSTGGPVALRELIPKLPASIGVPIFVVQHMPQGYTKSLAKRIDEISQIPVREAAQGMIIETNRAFIAPGGLHMGIAQQRGKLVIQTSDSPPEHNCRPSVDYTIRSLARVYGGGLLGVILTGMGRDGTEGCRLIKNLGGSVIAQHPEGCTVYGMPKVVVEERLADRVVPIEKMASWIVRMIEKSR
jgi:two-component system, chemotaxis family, protein-glutamate methylesterase/glutaminase